MTILVLQQCHAVQPQTPLNQATSRSRTESQGETRWHMRSHRIWQGTNCAVLVGICKSGERLPLCNGQSPVQCPVPGPKPLRPLVVNPGAGCTAPTAHSPAAPFIAGRPHAPRRGPGLGLGCCCYPPYHSTLPGAMAVDVAVLRFWLMRPVVGLFVPSHLAPC